MQALLQALLKRVFAPDRLSRVTMNGFFQLPLQGKANRRVFLTGEATPPAMAPVDVDLQYSHPDPLVIDDFEPSPGYDPGANNLSGNVTQTDLDTLNENLMHLLDPKSAHQTSGGKIEWSQASARYRSVSPDQNGQRDVRGYEVLTLGVAQHWEPEGQADPLEDFYVTLRSGNPANPASIKTRSIRAGSFVKIREPYYPKINTAWVTQRGQPARSVFTTLRIPLDAWTIQCMSAEMLDLQNVFQLELGFFADASGKIEIDSIAFSK